MLATVQFSADNFSAEEIERLTWECRAELARVEGLEFGDPVLTREVQANTRGDPVTFGVIALALVTNGALTAALEIIKSYVNRGIEGTFEGIDDNGHVVKLSLKGTKSAGI